MPMPEAVRLVDALPDGALIADADGVVLALNRPAALMLGLERRECLGRPLSEVLTLVDKEGTTWCQANTPYVGLATRTGVPEQSWLCPSGEEVLVTARIHRAEPRGPVSEVALSLRSGRGRARLDRDRSDLVATVAHELRSPLSGVKGFVQALLHRWDRLSDEQRRLMLETVNADADRLSRLIAELLDVARIDTGRLSLATRPVDLAVLVDRTTRSVRAATHRRILFEAEPGLPPAQADPDKFTQVVTNLLENAVRHGQGQVQVSLGRGDSSGVLRLSVRDDGPGIPRDMRRRVFTKFWSSGGGSGLGLYLVSGLTRAHGGTVEIVDCPDGGARIDVLWPAAAPLRAHG